MNGRKWTQEARTCAEGIILTAAKRTRTEGVILPQEGRTSAGTVYIAQEGKERLRAIFGRRATCSGIYDL